MRRGRRCDFDGWAGFSRGYRIRFGGQGFRILRPPRFGGRRTALQPRRLGGFEAVDARAQRGVFLFQGIEPRRDLLINRGGNRRVRNRSGRPMRDSRRTRVFGIAIIVRTPRKRPVSGLHKRHAMKRRKQRGRQSRRPSSFPRIRKWMSYRIRQFQPFSRHLALNGARIRIGCRRHQVQTMRGVMRVIRMLIGRWNCHDPCLGESPRGESDRVVRMRLFEIEQCSDQCRGLEYRRRPSPQSFKAKRVAVRIAQHGAGRASDYRITASADDDGTPSPTPTAVRSPRRSGRAFLPAARNRDRGDRRG